MNIKDFYDILETTEPVFLFKDTEYQILCLDGRYIAGTTEDDNDDQYFDSVDELLSKWTLNGIPIKLAFKEINFI